LRIDEGNAAAEPKVAAVAWPRYHGKAEAVHVAPSITRDWALRFLADSDVGMWTITQGAPTVIFPTSTTGERAEETKATADEQRKSEK
jgi:hypothetical protein